MVIVMATNKQSPIQIHNLDSELHSFIINGKIDDFKIKPEILLHLAKITNNNGWLGWSISTLSRSTRAALMLELAFITMKLPISENENKISPNVDNMQSGINITSTKDAIIEDDTPIQAIEPEPQIPHMVNTENDHVSDKAEPPMNIGRRNEILSAFS